MKELPKSSNAMCDWTRLSRYAVEAVARETLVKECQFAERDTRATRRLQPQNSER